MGFLNIFCTFIIPILVSNICRIGTMSLMNKLAFYPTLFYNVMMTKVSNRKWCDRVDETVVLGALPFKGMTTWLVTEENIRGVVTLNEDWEVADLCNTQEEWKSHGVEQLNIPTIDFTGSPSQENITKAVDFISDFRKTKRGSVYVHCKAGRTRSATVVACYLVKLHNWTPEQAVKFIEEKRPHIWLREKQLDSVNEYSKLCNNINSNTDKPTKGG